MTFEEIKKKLSEYKGLKKLLDAENTRIAELRSRLYTVRTTDYSGERVQCSSRESTYRENIIDRISMIEKRADEVQTKLFAIEDLIANNMGNLSDIEKSMVIDKYMNDMQWGKIYKKYYYTPKAKGAEKAIRNAIKKMAK